MLNNLTKYTTERRLSIGTNDNQYYQLKPKSGGSINMFKDNDGNERIWINCTKHFSIDCPNGDINIVSNDISLGEKDLTDDNLLVLVGHLNTYSNAMQLIFDLFNALITNPTLGDLFTPTPIAVRNPTVVPLLTQFATKIGLPANSGGIKDNYFKTSRVKSK